jgi:hypothetical protein
VYASRSCSPEELVAVEHSFVATADSAGVRRAFLRFADPRGIIFRPERVNARQWWEQSDEVSYQLRWYPTQVWLAASCDAGVTSGPWELTYQDGTVHGRGTYVTLWRRTRGGWRYLADVGTEHPAPRLPRPEPAAPAELRSGRGGGPGPAPSLAAEDSAFARMAASAGFAAALRSYAHPGLRLLRPRRAPALGLPAALATATADSARRYTATPGRAVVSSSGELGWSEGEYTLVHPRAGRRESGHYLRMWWREGGGPWRVLIDIVVPRPSERDE